ncbi:MAG: hypothetical protein P9L88_01100 [Candidatus Tantalella remota]|nr:hypothetical protein [Candidatus Tantalella remota]
MFRKTKVFNVFIILCFLLNSFSIEVGNAFTGLYPDGNANLSAASMLNGIAGVEHQDKGRIKVALQADLRLLSRKGVTDLKGIHKNLGQVFHPDDVQFFFNEAKEIENGNVRLMCRVWDQFSTDPRTYYAVFSLKSLTAGDPEVHLFSKKEYNSSRENIDESEGISARQGGFVYRERSSVSGSGMMSFKKVFGSATHKDDLRHIYKRIVREVERISADFKEKYGDDALDTAEIGIIVDPETQNRQVNTLMVNVDQKTKARRIGIYREFILGIHEMQSLIDHTTEGAVEQQDVLDHLVEGSVLHEIGHGFESYSGEDLNTLISDPLVRRAYAKLLGLDPEMDKWKIAEAVADLNIGGRGNGKYIQNKAAYLFYKFIRVQPEQYAGHPENTRAIIMRYFDINPHLALLQQKGDAERIAERVVQYSDLFFAEGTLWYKRNSFERSNEDRDQVREIEILLDRFLAPALDDTARASLAKQVAKHRRVALGVLYRYVIEVSRYAPEWMRLKHFAERLEGALESESVAARQGDGEEQVDEFTARARKTYDDLPKGIDPGRQKEDPYEAEGAISENKSFERVENGLLDRWAERIRIAGVVRRTREQGGLGYISGDAETEVSSSLGSDMSDRGIRIVNGTLLDEIVNTLIEIAQLREIKNSKRAMTNYSWPLIRGVAQCDNDEQALLWVDRFRGETLEELRPEDRSPLTTEFRDRIDEMFRNPGSLPTSALLEVDGRMFLDLGDASIQEMLQGVTIVVPDPNIPTRYTTARLLEEAADQNGRTMEGLSRHILIMVSSGHEIALVKEKLDRSGFSVDPFLLDTVDYGLLGTSKGLQGHPLLAVIMQRALAKYNKFLLGEIYHNDMGSSNFRVMARISGGEVADVQLLPVDFEDTGLPARQGTGEDDPVAKDDVPQRVNLPEGVVKTLKYSDKMIEKALADIMVVSAMSMWFKDKVLENKGWFSLQTYLKAHEEVRTGRIPVNVTDLSGDNAVALHGWFDALLGERVMVLNSSDGAPLYYIASTYHGITDKLRAAGKTASMRIGKKEIGKAVDLAGKTGVENTTHPNKRYTLIMTSEFFANGELGEQKKRYGDRFELDSVSARDGEQFVDKVLARAKDVEARTVVLVPESLEEEQLKRLTNVGIRFLRVDTSELLEGRSDDKAERNSFQQNTYVMMLLTRHITKDTAEDSAVYRLLKFFIGTHFSLDALSVKAYMDAIVKNRIPVLIRGLLSYKPAEAYRMPEYDKVAATLIAA